jgi:NAD(P)-dependent dehydrogenase (short-subunit alcohol dehydrogenase family)
VGQLTGRTVIITGGAAGIGRAALERTVAEGGRVVLIGGDEVASREAVAASRGEARFAPARRPGDTAEAVDAEARASGGLYALVNVLQSQAAWKPFVDKAEADFAQAAENLSAIRGAMRAAYPYLKRHGGRVVNVGSVYGATSFAYLSDAVASDYALQGLTRAVGVEWAQDNINVNYLAPGAIDIPEFRRWRDSHPAQIDARIQGLAMQRLGDPVEDFGGGLMFLLSDEACFLVGHPVYADGGQHLVAPVFEPGANLNSD